MPTADGDMDEGESVDVASLDAYAESQWEVRRRLALLLECQTHHQDSIT